MNSELLHAAFELTIKAGGATRHADAKASLEQRFPQFDFDMITEAYLAASRLHELAYTVADKNRDGEYTEAEALAELRRACPGFPEPTYSKALSQGWFESK